MSTIVQGSMRVDRGRDSAYGIRQDHNKAIELLEFCYPKAFFANPKVRLPLKRGIEKAVDAVVALLQQRSREVNGEEQLRHVAMLSANNETESITRATANSIPKNATFSTATSRMTRRR